MGQAPAKPVKPWADSGPFKIIETPAKRLKLTHPKPEDGAIMAATEMCLVHNIFVRILNCIYIQAPQVTLPQDITDFTTFMKAFVISIHEHHGNEEELFFPWLEEAIGEKGVMEKNVEQHHAFNPGLLAFETYVTALGEGKEVYDAKKVQKLIDDFGDILTLHLEEEVQCFEELKKYKDMDWKTWNNRVTDHAKKSADVEYMIPIFVTNLDSSFEAPLHSSHWPPFPWIIMQFFRFFKIPKHKGAWRFSCCDDQSRPRDLKFLAEGSGGK